MSASATAPARARGLSRGPPSSSAASVPSLPVSVPPADGSRAPASLELVRPSSRPRPALPSRAAPPSPPSPRRRPAFAPPHRRTNLACTWRRCTAVQGILRRAHQEGEGAGRSFPPRLSGSRQCKTRSSTPGADVQMPVRFVKVEAAPQSGSENATKRGLFERAAALKNLNH